MALMQSSQRCGRGDVTYGQRPLLRRKRDRGSIVFARPHAALREDLVLRDPLERFLEDFAGIGLEHDPLARPPAARIHHAMETLGEFVLVRSEEHTSELQS